MKKDLRYYMNLSYRIEVIPDTVVGGYTLHCPDLPGCMTCDEDIAQGFEMIENAKMNWFMVCLEDEIPIPEPYRIKIPQTA
ncbi:MAG: type II toxin-antitoxin system HicB family antitoxin [Defluviitaleaceae bacterium]|nr:type II toxin-antitoxin system HicB family antitoxin [Defluviitaleaceae bacterium]